MPNTSQSANESRMYVCGEGERDLELADGGEVIDALRDVDVGSRIDGHDEGTERRDRLALTTAAHRIVLHIATDVIVFGSTRVSACQSSRIESNRIESKKRQQSSDERGGSECVSGLVDHGRHQQGDK